MGERSERTVEIAARVRAERVRLGLSQADMARGLALSPSGYGHYDRGAQPFSVEQVLHLSTLLGRSVEWILGVRTALAEDEERLVVAYRAIDAPALRRFALDMVCRVPRGELRRADS